MLAMPFPALRAVAIVGLVALSAAFTGSAGAKDSVQLKFAWPDNLNAKVAFLYRNTSRRGMKAQSMTVYGRYNTKAQPMKGGFRVITENADIAVRSEGLPEGPQSKLQQALAKAMGKQPAFEIDRKGQFVRVVDAKQYRKTLEDVLNTTFADSPPEMRAKIIAAAAGAMTDEQIQAGASAAWNQIVGAWLAAKLDMGDVYKLKFKRPVQALGGATVTLLAEIQFIKRAACSARDPERACVELQMKTSADDDSVTAAIKALAASGGNPAMTVRAFYMTESIRVLTEPGTLIPHRMHSSKKTSMVVKANGRTQSVNQVDELKLAYSY